MVSKYFPFKKLVKKNSVLRLANEKPTISPRHQKLVQEGWKSYFKDGKTINFDDDTLSQMLIKDIDKRCRDLVTAMEQDDENQASGDALIAESKQIGADIVNEESKGREPSNSERQQVKVAGSGDGSVLLKDGLPLATPTEKPQESSKPGEAMKPNASISNPVCDDAMTKDLQANQVQEDLDQPAVLTRMQEPTVSFDAAMDEEDLIIKYGVENYKSLVKSHVRTQRGIILEKHIINRINEQEGLNFVEDIELKTMDFETFKICGRVDGIDREKGYLIEVKTRSCINGFNEAVNFRERLQCLTYMKLTQTSRCYLVESDGKGQQKMTIIEYDEKAFETEIVSHLRNFALKYRSMSEEEFILRVEKYPIV